MQGVSRRSFRANTVTKVTFLVLIAVVAISEPVLVLVFFVPVVGWMLWRDQDRISELEKRITALETPPRASDLPPQEG